MTNKFEFQPMEDFQREHLEKLLQNYTWLVPGWCARVTFRIDPQGQVTARCHTRYNYRDSFIDICPDFWQLSPSVQEAALVHELIHNFFNPLYALAVDVMEAVEDDDTPHSKVNRKTLEHFNDGGTEDMTNALVEFTRKMYGGTK